MTSELQKKMAERAVRSLKARAEGHDRKPMDCRALRKFEEDHGYSSDRSR